MIQDVKKIYLCTPDLALVTVLNGVNTDSVEYETHLKDYSELSFEVARFISVNGIEVESNGYEDLRVMMYLYLEDIGYFQMQEPETINDGDHEYKEIVAYSIEKEFEQKDWLGLKINTGDPDSLEQLAPNNLNDLGFAKKFVVFYSPQEPELSFVDLMLTKMSGWTVGHIDYNLRNLVIPRIDVQNSNLYAIMTSDVAPRLDCIFVFDFLRKEVNAYHKNSLSEFDTNIFIGFRNLANEVEISVDEDSVFTEFRVRGDNDLSIRTVNYGSDQIFDLSYFLGKPWMDDSLVEKYNAWIAARESRRSDYIDLARVEAKLNEQIYELKYRVPSDATYWQQWDNMNQEGLEENLKYFTAQLEMLQMSVDDNPTFDANGKYVPRHDPDETNKTDHAWYEQRLYASDNGYGGYNTYKEIVTYVLPYIEQAIKNLNLPVGERISYADDGDKDWTLYGLVELKAKLKSNKEDKLPALSRFAEPWTGSQSQKEKYIDKNGYYTAGRREYEEVTGIIAQIEERISILESQISDLEDELARKQSAENEIKDYVSIDGESNTFTEEEKKLIKTLLVDTDYTNNNILTTSIDTLTTTINHELELYNDAVNKISEVAQPQYSFTVTLDNLLRIPAFEGWVEDLRLLRFIRLGIRDDYSVKLRVVGIKYNPCEVTPDLELEFSSMITSKSGRNDFTDIINNANNRGSKNSITLGQGGSSSELEYLTSLLTTLGKTGALNGIVGLGGFGGFGYGSGIDLSSKISVNQLTGDFSLILENLTADSVVTKVLEADEAKLTALSSNYADIDTIISKMVNAESANFGELSSKILNAGTINVNKITGTSAEFNTFMSGTIFAGALQTQIANIEGLAANSQFVNYLQGISSTVVTNTVNQEYVSSVIAGHISANDITSGTLSLGDGMSIESSSDSGHKLVMNDSVIQIYGKDQNDNEYVGVQLGYDASGNPSLIIQNGQGVVNEQGTTIITPSGITADAVADGLIVNDMIHDGTINESKLNFSVWKVGDHITLQNLYTDAGEQFGSQWSNFQDRVDTIDHTAIKNVVTQYYLSDSSTELTGGTGWTTNQSELRVTPGKYIWQRNIVTYVDGTTNENNQTAVMITGNQGGNGSYTYIKYSAVRNPTANDMVDPGNMNPLVHEYIGIQITNTNSAPTSPSAYTWSKLGGESAYVHTAYATSQTGTDFNTTPFPGATHLGIYISADSDAMDVPASSYTWSLIKGDSGDTSYFHIKYADELQQDGYPLATDMKNEPQMYIGTYADHDMNDSDDPHDYTWVQIQGTQGIPGQTGPDGRTSYLHIKYSNDGVNFTDHNGEDPGDYIGTYVSFDSADHLVFSDYTWKKIVGETGIGIASVKEYYQTSTDPNTPPSKEQDPPLWDDETIPTLDQTNKYLWNYEVITYTDSHQEPTEPHIVGVYGEGASGRGISSVQREYLISELSTGVTRDTDSNNWSPTVLSPTAEKRFLWAYDTINYTSGDPDTYGPFMIGTYSEGTQGRGISRVVNYYLASPLSSDITNETEGVIGIGTIGTSVIANNCWTTEVPTINNTDRYLWNYEEIIYDDGTSESTDPMVIGVYGEVGATGRGILQVTEYYARSTGTAESTIQEEFARSVDPVNQDWRYLWNYEEITYTDNSISKTNKRIIAMYAEDGEPGRGIEGITPMYLATNQQSGVTKDITTSQPWTFTVQSPTSDKKYLWSYDIISYTNGDTVSTDPHIIGVYGDSGDSAYSYSLIVSHAAISKAADGTYNPGAITLLAKRSQGTKSPTNYSGRFKIETTADNNTWTEVSGVSSTNRNNYTYTIPQKVNDVDIVAVRCSLYLAGGTTTLLDQQTIPIVSDGADGADAYTVILTNESHTFAGGTSAALEANTECSVIAYKGSTQVYASIGTITGQPTGMYTTIYDNYGLNSRFRVLVTPEMTEKSGTLTIPITVDGKIFTKQFTYSLALTGSKGRGITSVVNMYLASSSSIVPNKSDPDWTETVQTIDATKKYLWNYEIIYYDSGLPDETNPVIIGVYKAGQISNLKPLYFKTRTSPDDVPVDYDFPFPQVNKNQWLETPPAWEEGYYLWTCTEISFTDSDELQHTKPYCDQGWIAAETVYTELSSTISGVESIADNAAKQITNRVWKDDFTKTIKDLNVGGPNLFNIRDVKSYRNGVLYNVQNVAIRTDENYNPYIQVYGNPNVYPGFRVDVSNVEIDNGYKSIIIDGYYQYDIPGNANEFNDVYIAYQGYKQNDESYPQSQERATFLPGKNRFVNDLIFEPDVEYVNIGIGQAYSQSYSIKALSIRDQAFYDPQTSISSRLSEQIINLDGITTTVLNMRSGQDGTFIQNLATQEFTADGYHTTFSDIYTDLRTTESNSSEALQTANKFYWIVKRGASSQSEMELTSDFVRITSDSIDLEGKVTFSSLDSQLQNRVSSYGLAMKANSSSYDNNNIPGSCYIHGYDQNGVPANVDGYVIWNSKKYTIPKTSITPPVSILPNNAETIIYIVFRLSTASQITGTMYMVWRETPTGTTWKWSQAGNTTRTGDWTWAEAKDIVLGQVTYVGAGQELFKGYLYNPARSSIAVIQDVSNPEEEYGYAGDAIVWYDKNNVEYNAAVQMLKNWSYSNAISQNTKINGGYIEADTISAGHIAVPDLAAINANMGTITAGILKSKDYAKSSIANDVFAQDGIGFDLDNKLLHSKNFAIDSNGNARFRGTVTTSNVIINNQNGQKIASYGDGVKFYVPGTDNVTAKFDANGLIMSKGSININNRFTVDTNGSTTISYNQNDANGSNIFTLQRLNADSTVTKFVSVDSSGNVVINPDTIKIGSNSLTTRMSMIDQNISEIGKPNMLLDVNAPSLDQVSAENKRFFTDKEILGIEPEYIDIADAPIRVSHGVSFKVTATGANGRDLCWYGDGGTVPLVPGKTYTVSTYARIKECPVMTLRFRYYGIDDYVGQNAEVRNTTWQRYSWSFKYPSTQSSTGTRICIGCYKQYEGTLELCGFKLEENEIATTWSLAPEELYHDLDSVRAMTTSNQTFIEQNSEKIQAIATKSEVEEMISGVNIGATNLLYNSSFTENFNGWSITNGDSSEIVIKDGLKCGHIAGEFNKTKILSQDIFDDIENDPIGQIYTYSADIKLENYVAGTGTGGSQPFLALYLSGHKEGPAWLGATYVGGNVENSNSNLPKFNNSEEWVHVVYTFKFEYKPIDMKLQIYCRNCTGDLYYRNLKLERGNKATEWSPSPDDAVTSVTKRVEDAETTIKAHSEAIKLFAKTDEIKEVVVNQIGNYYVGGRNLLMDTNAPSLIKLSGPANRYFSDTSVTTDMEEAAYINIADPPVQCNYGARFNIKTTGSSGKDLCWYYKTPIPLVDGQEYTLSCYARLISGAKGRVRFRYGASSYDTKYIDIENTDWQRISWTFTYDAQSTGGGTSGVRIYIGSYRTYICTFELCGFQLEKGNEVSLWGVSTEDVQVKQNSSQSPNLSPFFSRSLEDIYSANTRPTGYWRTISMGNGWSFTQLADGWVHVELDNSSGTKASRSELYVSVDSNIIPSEDYTFLFEFKNAVLDTVVGSGNGSGRNYIMQASNTQFWGNSAKKTLEGLSSDNSTLTYVRDLPTDGSTYIKRFVKTSEAANSQNRTENPTTMVCLVFFAGIGEKYSFDYRASLYRGEYLGSYVPSYIVDQTDVKLEKYVTNTQMDSALDVTSSQITQSVSKTLSASVFNLLDPSTTTKTVTASAASTATSGYCSFLDDGLTIFKALRDGDQINVSFDWEVTGDSTNGYLRLQLQAENLKDISGNYVDIAWSSQTRSGHIDQTYVLTNAIVNGATKTSATRLRVYETSGVGSATITVTNVKLWVAMGPIARSFNTTVEQTASSLTALITEGGKVENGTTVSTTMTRMFNDGVLVGKALANGTNVCALVSSSGGFEIVPVYWTNYEPAVGSTTYASFGAQSISIGGTSVSNFATKDMVNGYYATCTNTGGTTEKKATCSGFVLEEGAIIHITFTNVNTAINPTLSVNSTDDKPIKIGNSTLNGISPWRANETIIMRYDGSQWQIVGQMNLSADNIQTGTLNGVVINASQGSTLGGWSVSKGQTADDPTNEDDFVEYKEEPSLRSSWAQIQSDYQYQIVLKATKNPSYGAIFIKNAHQFNSTANLSYPFWVKPDGSMFSTNPELMWYLGNAAARTTNTQNVRLRRTGSGGIGFAEYSSDSTSSSYVIGTLVSDSGEFLPTTLVTPTVVDTSCTITANHSFVFGSVLFINIWVTTKVSIQATLQKSLLRLPSAYRLSGTIPLLGSVYSKDYKIDVLYGPYNHNNTTETGHIMVESRTTIPTSTSIFIYGYFPI